MKRLIQLNKDIRNPQFDRRHKHGIEAIEVFKKGSRYLHQKADHGEWLRTIETERIVRLEYDTVKQILEASTETFANTAEEAMHLSGVYGGWYTKRMCQLLWETNRDLFNSIVLRMIEEENNE